MTVSPTAGAARAAPPPHAPAVRAERRQRRAAVRDERAVRARHPAAGEDRVRAVEVLDNLQLIRGLGVAADR